MGCNASKSSGAAQPVVVIKAPEPLSVPAKAQTPQVTQIQKTSQQKLPVPQATLPPGYDASVAQIAAVKGSELKNEQENAAVKDVLNPGSHETTSKQPSEKGTENALVIESKEVESRNFELIPETAGASEIETTLGSKEKEVKAESTVEPDTLDVETAELETAPAPEDGTQESCSHESEQVGETVCEVHEAPVHEPELDNVALPVDSVEESPSELDAAAALNPSDEAAEVAHQSFEAPFESPGNLNDEIAAVPTDLDNPVVEETCETQDIHVPTENEQIVGEGLPETHDVQEHVEKHIDSQELLAEESDVQGEPEESNVPVEPSVEVSEGCQEPLITDTEEPQGVNSVVEDAVTLGSQIDLEVVEQPTDDQSPVESSEQCQEHGEIPVDGNSEDVESELKHLEETEQELPSENNVEDAE